ncbi:hypothetical protein HPB47_007201 [Ixodes persulcatus]|uniref:Uncharacterized protein n=1 Tax=Ixodes persulcatus TaxID=34615 RepID=A0AC60P817_IXOPE|nr:hypothetical protein HPB47_007201 [Ixodes persulcatus]
MDVSKLRIPELVAICEELGISVGQAERNPIMELLRKEEVSDGDPKSRKKDLVSREERVLAPSRARTRQVAAETRLSADGTTDAVPHDADSKLEALEVRGDSDPARERDEASQASDVCFLWDKGKASMESSAEKPADRKAEQDSGCPSRHPRDSEIKPRRDRNRRNAGALPDKSSVSSKFIKTTEPVLNSQLVLQPGIQSGAEIKPGLSDRDFEKSIESIGTRAFLPSCGSSPGLARPDAAWRTLRSQQCFESGCVLKQLIFSSFGGIGDDTAAAAANIHVHMRVDHGGVDWRGPPLEPTRPRGQSPWPCRFSSSLTRPRSGGRIETVETELRRCRLLTKQRMLTNSAEPRCSLKRKCFPSAFIEPRHERGLLSFSSGAPEMLVPAASSLPRFPGAAAPNGTLVVVAGHPFGSLKNINGVRSLKQPGPAASNV